MNKKLLTIVLIITAAFMVSSCDSRRNKILSSLLVSPTVTETPLPPTETPIPTETPAPTLTPTPFVPVENLDLLLYGDFDLAEHNLSTKIKNSKNPEEILQAQIDLMELTYLRGNYSSCSGVMDDIQTTLENINIYTNPLQAKAWYLNAQCAAELDDNGSVIESLDKYLAYRPDTPLLSDVYIQIAYAYRSLENYSMFRKYIDRAVADDSQEISDYLKLDYAVSYQLEGDYDEAIRQLSDLYTASSDENIKAGINYYLGISYNAISMKEQTIARYQESVNSFPKSYYSYLMLVWLLDNNQTVSDYQRGLINYYIGQYALANDAFHRYVKNEPGNDGSAWYFIGVCQMNLADYEGAASSFTRIIEEYPQNRYYVSAWDELSYVQWAYLNKYKAGAETLTNYVSQHPDQADSASFLYEAGRILERGNYLKEASKTWGRLIDEYPLYENSKKALFLAAVSSYRAGDYESSLAYLNRMLLVSGIPEDQSQANFWIAKNYQKKNDSESTQKYFKLAAELTETGYYSLRASEILEGKDYLSFSKRWNLNIDLRSERQVADQWMMLTFNLPFKSLNDRSTYESDEAYLKGLEYYVLGDYLQASIWFDKERETLGENAAALYAFLDELTEKKIYSPAAYTSRQILSAAGLYEEDRTFEVPNYFNHIRFGPWYSSYVSAASKEYDISPFILYAIMKQESMFNPWVSSSAGARGLMQIMPETGAELAKTLHWPQNYKTEDLNRVPVAVSFAGSFLKRVYNYFDQSVAAMITSYNGGAGNTQQWLNAAENDPDLLFEVIRFPETKNYLENIYRNTRIYEWLYEK